MNDTGNLTAKRFQEICWQQLLVRALIETLPKDTPQRFTPARIRTTIHLFSLEQDGDTNQFFTGLTYVDEDPIEQPKDFSHLTGLTQIPLGDREGRLNTIDEFLNWWGGGTPLWLADKPLVACKKAGNDVQEIKPWDLKLLQHFARLETRLAYELKGKVHNRWVLSGIFHRLVALIRQQNRVWEQIVS